MNNSELIDIDKATGSREFMLQEHQCLYSLYQSTKEVGDNRLNFYVTFVAASLTITATMYSFILPELRPWLVLCITSVLITVGLITYRKMLQIRVEVVAYRRRLNRIRGWFLKFYPDVISGIPYSDSQVIKMDWGGKYRLGSTAFSVAFINTALLAFSMLAMCIMIFGIKSFYWSIPLSSTTGMVSWIFHLAWKNYWMKAGELNDEKSIEELKNIQNNF